MQLGLRTTAALGGTFLSAMAGAGEYRLQDNPYFHGHAYHHPIQPAPFAYWYGHGTPGPGYWAGYSTSIGFPSISPQEYYPAYGNHVAGRPAFGYGYPTYGQFGCYQGRVATNGNLPAADGEVIVEPAPAPAPAIP